MRKTTSVRSIVLYILMKGECNTIFQTKWFDKTRDPSLFNYFSIAEVEEEVHVFFMRNGGNWTQTLSDRIQNIFTDSIICVGNYNATQSYAWAFVYLCVMKGCDRSSILKWNAAGLTPGFPFKMVDILRQKSQATLLFTHSWKRSVGFLPCARALRESKM